MNKSTGKRKHSISSYKGKYIEHYKSGEFDFTDIRGFRDELIDFIEDSDGIIEDRVRELIEWLKVEEGCAIEKIDLFYNNIMQYKNNDLLFSNPEGSWDDLSLSLKNTLNPKNEGSFYASEPVYLLEMVTDLAKKIRDGKREVNAIDQVMIEIKAGDIKKEKKGTLKEETFEQRAKRLAKKIATRPITKYQEKEGHLKLSEAAVYSFMIACKYDESIEENRERAIRNTTTNRNANSKEILKELNNVPIDTLYKWRRKVKE